MDNFKLILAALTAPTFTRAKIAVAQAALTQLEEEHAQAVVQRDHPDIRFEMTDPGYKHSIQLRIDGIEEQIDQWRELLAKVQEDHNE